MAGVKQLTMAEEVPDHSQIYRTQADRYERLVSREDYQGNILATLDRIAPLTGAEALVEFFFGPELARQVMEQQQVIVPECTGIWWRWG